MLLSKCLADLGRCLAWAAGALGRRLATRGLRSGLVLEFLICRTAWKPYSCFGMNFYDKLKFNNDGLIPAIIQEQSDGRVLMMGWMNRESLEKTVASGKTVFWSRSRQKFWMKGETSGHVQIVKDIAFDCDGDVLLIQVEQTGAACHEGYRSCFFRSVD